MLMKKLVAGAATTVLAMGAMSTLAHGQEITGGINGEITDDAGHPLSGVKVKVTYAPTGTTLTTTTTKEGFFSVRDLQVGGPYTVTASDGTHPTKSVQVDQITIGAPYDLNFSLDSGAVQEVTVKATRLHGATSQVQTGPRSTFTAADIQTLPTFARDLKDIARLNPFVTIDPTNSNALIIAGSNPRLSTIYVDGVKQSDDFGLNGNGYPTQRSPISIDAVKAFNVEIAPYDVQYGEFQGGVLNIVTKGGQNQLHGGAFYEYDSSGLGGGDKVGSSAVGQPPCPSGAQTGTFTGYSSNFNINPTNITCGDRFLGRFKDKNYGGYLSGAIIPDRVFFFFDYEKFEGLAPTGYVPSDVSGSNPVPGVTTAAVNDVVNILKNTYNYNAGGIGGGTPTTDEKYFARLDANITDNQHLFVTYQSTKGDTLNFPNGSTSSSTGILALSSNYYTNEQNLEAYTADLTSHWTSKFSTEVEYTHKTVDTISAINGDPAAGEFKIQLQKNPISGAQPSIYVGPDISRQANNLATVDEQYKVKANYVLGTHTITVGYEHEDTTSADLFVQNANGTYTFGNNCGATGYDAYGVPLNLSNKQACQLVYANAFDNVSATAASSETTTIQTGYIQDEWYVLPTLSLKGGLRYENYGVNSAPALNPLFVSQLGFPNNVTLNGDDILMPRFGFNWRPDPTLTVSGGLGLFSGGNPTVYFYDSFDNPGNLLGSVNLTCSGTNTAGCSSALSNVNITKVGAAALTANTASANAGSGIVNSVDPNFKVPSDWKASISIHKTLNFADYPWMGGFGPAIGNDWTFHLDDVYSTVQNGVQWIDPLGEQHILGTAPDSRVEYDPSRFALANTPPYDIELKNTHKGHGNVIAVGFGKSWPSGWDFDLNFTHEDVKEISPATSSVAVSNYRQDAFSDPNNPPLATSVYNIDKEVKLNVNYQHKFFGDNTTTIRLFGDWRTGLPYSYTFQAAYPSGSGVTSSSTGNFDETFGQFALLASTWGELLYVPKTDATGNVTKTSDPKVTYASNFDVNAFNQFLKATGLIKYAGSISPRNAFTSSDVTRFDLEVVQQFPAFVPGNAKGEFYIDLFNIGNLIDKNWGVIKQTAFPYLQSPVQAVNCQAAMLAAAKLPTSTCAAGTGNFYQYNPGSATQQTLGSTTGGNYYPAWQIKLGIRYKF